MEENKNALSAEAIVIVDPFSTGAHLAAAVCNKGYACVRVFSTSNSPVAALVQQGVHAEFVATIEHDEHNSDKEFSIRQVFYIFCLRL